MIGKNYSCDKRVHFLIQISRLSLKNYQFRTKKWPKIQKSISDGGAEPFENANFDHLENGPNLKFSSLKNDYFSQNRTFSYISSRNTNKLKNRI